MAQTVGYSGYVRSPRFESQHQLLLVNNNLWKNYMNRLLREIRAWGRQSESRSGKLKQCCRIASFMGFLSKLASEIFSQDWVNFNFLVFSKIEKRWENHFSGALRNVDRPDILSARNLIDPTFDWPDILLTRHFINQTFCRPDIWSTSHFSTVKFVKWTLIN